MGRGSGGLGLESDEQLKQMLLHDTIEWELRNCSVLETAESETKTPADPVSAESPSPGSEMAAFLQCLHMALHKG